MTQYINEFEWLPLDILGAYGMFAEGYIRTVKKTFKNS